MIPVSVMQIDEIPLNNNGKIDVKRLPEMEMSKNTYVPPAGRIEKEIVNIWQKILETSPIGINDDFYNLGGDSIKAIRIVSLLQNEGIYCSPSDIFNYKTPYLIAQNVDKSHDISYDATEGVIELLPIQSYFFDKINRDNFAQDTILKSKITLDCGLLQKAFDKLCDVHDMLRARFRIHDGQAIQEILPLNSRVCEINEFNSDDNLEETFIKILRDANSSMDISKKLIDVSLLHHGHECYVIFVIHHLIIDGVSWSILLEDLTQIYIQLLNNNEINVIKPYPYKYWIEDVRHFAERISDEEKMHWIHVNNLLDESEIKGNARFFNFTIENVEWNANNKLMLTEEEFLALGIARSYKKTYGKDVIFNRESHGRDETLISNINRTVGWFTVQYPVAVEVSAGRGYDVLTQDAVNIKKRFEEIEHLGLNYSSLAYSLNEFEFKYCPVTFNFLSSEFVFKNELFESVGIRPVDDKVIESLSETLHYGVDLNIYKVNDFYLIKGRCAVGTYLDDKFDEFVDNIKKDLKFINDYLNDA
jgi:acyl carrier protein